MRLLSREELKTLKGITISRQHLHRRIKAGTFPRPVKVGEGRNAWPEVEIDRWIATLIADRDHETPAAA